MVNYTFRRSRRQNFESLSKLYIFLLFCPLFSLLVPCVRIFSQKPQEVRIYTLAVEEEQIKIVTGLGQKFIQPRSQPVSKIDVCFFF